MDRKSGYLGSHSGSNPNKVRASHLFGAIFSSVKEEQISCFQAYFPASTPERYVTEVTAAQPSQSQRKVGVQGT